MMGLNSSIVRIVAVLLLVVLGENSTFAQKTIVYDFEILQNNKSKVKTNIEVKKAVSALVDEANKKLKISKLNIVGKPELPPSKDKHDFYSLSIYWWPNPNTKSGLPYIPKDGKPNPGRLRIKDLSNLTQISDAVKTLGLAYFYTGDKRYATKGEELLKGWFINPSTKMNPNLNYSGSIPGISDGRPEGIIDGRYFVELIDGVILMRGGINIETYNAVVGWFREFNRWMEQSDLGKEGKKLTNNIGTSYYLQRITYLRFIGNDTKARSLINNEISSLIRRQFGADGGQKLENRRTRSWNYSIANLKYWFNIAKVSEDMGIDLWNGENRLLAKGYDYLEPYGRYGKKWESAQILKVDYEKTFSGLLPMAERKLQGKSRNQLPKNTAPTFVLSEVKF